MYSRKKKGVMHDRSHYFTYTHTGLHKVKPLLYCVEVWLIAKAAEQSRANIYDE